MFNIFKKKFLIVISFLGIINLNITLLFKIPEKQFIKLFIKYLNGD